MYKFGFSGITYKWNCIVFIILHLASFTQQKLVEVHPRRSMYHSPFLFIHLYGLILSFVHSFFSIWSLGLFPPFGYY